MLKTRLLSSRLAALCLLALTLAGCAGTPLVRPEPDHFKVAEGAEGRRFRTHDNLTLFGQWWEPNIRHPRGVVLLVHGTGQHSGFYAPWANELTAHGYAVFGIDLRGWGQSQGYGRRGYVGNYDEYVDDLELAFREAHYRYPAVPLFVEGDSLGGDVALLANLSERFPMAGLVLHAPAVQPNPGMGWLRVGGVSVTSVATIGRISPNAPLLPIMSAFARMAFFDEATRQRFVDDPLCVHDALPAAYVIAMNDASERIEKNLVNIRTPLLVLHGTQDNLVPLSSSELLMKEAGSEDKTLEVYEGGSHASLSDAGYDKVWSDIVIWLNAHTRPAAQPVAASTTP